MLTIKFTYAIILQRLYSQERCFTSRTCNDRPTASIPKVTVHAGAKAFNCCLYFYNVHRIVKLATSVLHGCSVALALWCMAFTQSSCKRANYLH